MNRYRMCVCGQRVLDIDRGHPERCRGPRLRQPVHEPWDWAGHMAAQDADDRRANGGHEYGTNEADMPRDRRH